MCKRDKSTSSRLDGLLFHSFPFKLFVLKSLIKDRANVLDRIKSFGGLPFHHLHPMLLQPVCGGLCRVASRLVLLEFPPFLFVLKSPLRGRQQLLLQNVLIRGCVESAFIEGQLSLALRAESSPRIHRQVPTVPFPVQELHSPIWPRQSCVVGCLL